MILLSALKGGFFFHPTGEDLSVGTPERKKPLECEVSVYSNSEIAIAARIPGCESGTHRLRSVQALGAPGLSHAGLWKTENGRSRVVVSAPFTSGRGEL
jgi:hypothetical protein